jgi:16S rRNA (uracil1498-N3)-methyltransferase
MHRFFIPTEWIQPPLVRFQGETARQIERVLRLTSGTMIAILDGSPLERSVRLTLVEHDRVEGEIISETRATGEPLVHLSLYIGMTQRAKFEWILQKGTELGVSTFIPVITSRSLVRETAGEARKAERWESILREAAEQSGRARIPQILSAMQLALALEHGKKDHNLSLIAWEKETSISLKESLSCLDRTKVSSVAVLIGPEGGFGDDEIHLALDKGWTSISLGRRILRMETAAITLTALILHELGELDPPDGAATDS